MGLIGKLSLELSSELRKDKEGRYLQLWMFDDDLLG
jgi:hypothetical protein